MVFFIFLLHYISLSQIERNDLVILGVPPPPPPSAQKWEYPLRTLAKKMPKYLVLNPKIFSRRLRRRENTPIYPYFHFLLQF